MPSRPLRVARGRILPRTADASITMLLSALCTMACGGRILDDAPSLATAGDPGAQSFAGAANTAANGTAVSGSPNVPEEGSSDRGEEFSPGGVAGQAGCGFEAIRCGIGPDAACVDPWRDPLNCGNCGVVCPRGEICVGACTLAACRDTFMIGFQRSLESGSAPSSVVTGDWNADGRLDIATANGGDDSVSIFLGCGAGAFALRADFSTGDYPQAIASADLNGDQNADLATANRDASTVSVLLGVGDGSFSSRVDYAVAAQPISLVISDLNRDGMQDIAVATHSPSGVTVLWGNGDGSLATGTGIAMGGYPNWIAIADLNGDSAKDIVTANSGSGYGLNALLSSGGGSYESAKDIKSDLPEVSVVAADMNGDGVPDLGVADASVRGPGCGMGLLPGNGDGTFANKVRYSNTAGQCYHSITAGDLNSDGRPDLVASSGKKLAVVLGPAALSSTIPSTCAFEGANIALGDVNGDGNVDVVGTNAETNRVHLLLGSGDGTLR